LNVNENFVFNKKKHIRFIYNYFYGNCLYYLKTMTKLFKSYSNKFIQSECYYNIKKNQTKKIQRPFKKQIK
jgi:hypothetical protein